MFMLLLVLGACTNSSQIPQAATSTVTIVARSGGEVDGTGTAPAATNTFALATSSIASPTTRSASASLTGRIAYNSSDSIWIMNADGSGKIQLTRAGPGETDYDPSWAPDGSQIAFRSTRAEPGDMEGIIVVSVDGSGEFKLTQGYLAGFPAWSPNGTTIAFATGSGIATIQRDGSGLTSLHAEGEYPVWSANGSQIAFMATRDGNVEIYKMNNDGSAQTNLTNNPADDAFPAWSPDGMKIAFMSKRDGENNELYVMNADGSQVIRLTNSPDPKAFPIWTPEGRIVFNGGLDSSGAIRWYLVNADGSDMAELEQLRLSGAVNTIDWLP